MNIITASEDAVISAYSISSYAEEYDLDDPYLFVAPILDREIPKENDTNDKKGLFTCFYGDKLIPHSFYSLSDRPPEAGKSFKDYYLATFSHLKDDEKWKTFPLSKIRPSYVEYDGRTGESLLEHYEETDLNAYFMGFPGFGRPHGDCGDKRAVKECPICGPHDVLQHCERLLCPVCNGIYRRKQAKEIDLKIRGIWNKYKKAGIVYGNPSNAFQHWILSPPQDIFPNAQDFMRSDDDKTVFDNLNFLYNEAKKLIGKASIRISSEEWRKQYKAFKKDPANNPRPRGSPIQGGELAFHGFRKKHQNGTSCNKAKCSEEHEWEWGYHFHYMGFGYLDVQPFLDAGWVLKHKPVKGNKARNIFATAHYILSHASIIGRSTVEKSNRTVYGYDPGRPIELIRRNELKRSHRSILDFSTKAIKKNLIMHEDESGELKDHKKIDDKCRKCGSYQTIQKTTSEGYPKGDQFPAIRKITTYEYSIRENYLRKLMKILHPPPDSRSSDTPINPAGVLT